MSTADAGAGLALPLPERTGAGFGFPYAAPYANQLDLMAALFAAIEQRKVAVMESPTGTGKSLSVICAALTWLHADARRAQLGTLGQPAAVGEDAGRDEPDWVTAHAEARHRQDLARHEAELAERIQRIRTRQEELLALSKKQERNGTARPRKKIRIEGSIESADEDDDARFLPSDLSDSEEGPPAAKSKKKNSRFRVLPYTDRITSDSGGGNDDEDNMHLTPAVRALIAELAASRPRQSRTGEDEEDEEPESTPKIFFASRTHSQLSQFVEELRKTLFSGAPAGHAGVDLKWTDHHPVRMVPLGSRKQLCIHPGVQKLGARRGGEAMNEKCLELMKGGKKKQDIKAADADAGTSKTGRCQFLPANDALGHAQMLDFRDHALASVQDIEDLAELGRELQICPYYGARTAARQAELITLPYPLLLSRASRQALALSLKDAVIIIDEAHNLIDTVLSSHSVLLSLANLRAAKAGLDIYLARFASRLKGRNETSVRKVRAVIGALEEWCVKEAAAAAAGGKAVKNERVMTANEFIVLVGGTFDQVNFLTLQSYLQESQLLRKVISYIDVQAQREAEKEAQAAAATAAKPAARKSAASKSASGSKSVAKDEKDKEKDKKRDDRTVSMAAMMSGMYAIEAFLLSLTNRNDDGRVFVSLSPTTSGSQVTGSSKAREPYTVTLRYQLLNPAESFAEVVQEARSVVLLGGTMEPMSDFRTQLFPTIPGERFTTFSCGHIIPPSNLHAVVIPTAPRTNRALEFKWDARSNTALLDDLGTVLVNLCAVVPGGVVVFLPSYSFLDAVWGQWEKSGLLGRLGAKKKIFQEPKSTADVEVVFEKYAAAIASAMSGAGKKANDATTGALMFAVVGAKLSEGINFSDDLARAVIMVGMPFANAASPELAERMRYVRELAKTSPLADKGSKLDAGNELYLNMCMKAVNQSIGRAIRHKNDYAALILLDRRYSRADIRNRLPGWIRNEVKTVEQFGPAMAGLGAFFRGKKQAAT